MTPEYEAAIEIRDAVNALTKHVAALTAAVERLTDYVAGALTYKGEGAYAVRTQEVKRD